MRCYVTLNPDGSHDMGDLGVHRTSAAIAMASFQQT
jgi:hypothetical protein